MAKKKDNPEDEKSSKKPSIAEFRKNDPNVGYKELKTAGYSDSDIEKYSSDRRAKYDAERKSEKTARASQVLKLARQLKSAGITNFKTKKGTPLDISDARRLLAGKPKSKPFKELISRILSSAGRHVSTAISGLKMSAKEYMPSKKKDDNKNKPMTLVVPPGAKIKAAKNNSKKP
jgi:hypothetical protein